MQTHGDTCHILEISLGSSDSLHTASAPKWARLKCHRAASLAAPSPLSRANALLTSMCPYTSPLRGLSILSLFASATSTKQPLLYICKGVTLQSVRSVGLTHQTLERKSRIRTQPPNHTTYLMQPDTLSNSQHAPDAAHDTQDTIGRQTTSSLDKRGVRPLLVSDLGHPGHNRFHSVKQLNLLQEGLYCSNKQGNSHPA